MNNENPDDITRESQTLGVRPMIDDTQPIPTTRGRQGRSTRFWVMILIVLIISVFGIAIGS